MLIQEEVKEIYVWEDVQIPSAYQIVEYIASGDANCCINTNMIPTRDFELEFEFLNERNSSSNVYIFGTHATTSNPRLNIRLGSTEGQYDIFTNNSSGSAFSIFSGNIGLKKVHNVKISASGSTIVTNVNGSETTTTYSPNVTYASPIRLFNMSSNTATGIEDMRIYKFRLWNNGTLVRDMIPCYRKSDNVIGMYDMVGGVFYTNANSGTLKRGGAIPMDLKEYSYINSLSPENAVTELNYYSKAYYDKLSAEGHMRGYSLIHSGDIWYDAAGEYSWDKRWVRF